MSHKSRQIASPLVGLLFLKSIARHGLGPQHILLGLSLLAMATLAVISSQLFPDLQPTKLFTILQGLRVAQVAVTERWP